MALPGNDRCFDCDAPLDSPWVSITYGTLLCIECAGEHRSLGVHVSFVRSLALDALKLDELRALSHSGNAKMRDFLAGETVGVAASVWRSLPLELRYHTPAADLYRRRLQAMLDGVELPTEMLRLKPPPQRAQMPTHPPLGVTPRSGWLW